MENSYIYADSILAGKNPTEKSFTMLNSDPFLPKTNQYSPIPPISTLYSGNLIGFDNNQQNKEKKTGLNDSQTLLNNINSSLILPWQLKTDKNMNIEKIREEIDSINNELNMDPHTNLNNSSTSLSKKKKSRFSPEEDEKLRDLVKKNGTRQWQYIASLMNGRSARQCRDRYVNYLVPGFFNGQWSNDEDELLLELYKTNGPKWSVIQKYFPNRSSNSLKNRWNYFLSKQSENSDIDITRKKASGEEFFYFDECKLVDGEDFLRAFDLFSINCEDCQILTESINNS